MTVATATAIPDVSDTLPSHVDLDNKVELITTAKEHIPVHLNASGMTKPIINAESHAHIVEPEKPTKAAIGRFDVFIVLKASDRLYDFRS